MLDFFARRQHRVARSTFAAELHALADALEIGKLINFALAEVMLGPISATALTRLEEQGQWPLPLEACVDARSVFDALRVADVRQPIEASLLVTLLQTKESLLSCSLSRLWWIDTRDMAAHGLNKGIVAPGALMELCRGVWKLQYPAIAHVEATKVNIPAPCDDVN